MKKSETLTRSQKAAHEGSAARLYGIAEWAHALNEAKNEEEALRSFLPEIFRELEAESLYLTADAGGDRQRVRARIESDRELEIIAGGETASSTQTMLARAIGSNAPARFDNMARELAPDEIAGALVCPAAQSALVAPLVVGGRLTGALVASTSRIASFKAEDETLASLAANMLAATLERINLSEQAKEARAQEMERARHAELIEQLNRAARSTLDLDRILLHGIDALAHALPASFIVLRQVSFGVPEKVLRAWTPGHDRPPLEVHAPVSKQERAIYSEQRPVSLEDLRTERAASGDLAPLAERLGARSVYFAPLVYGGQVLA
ncbi:MAG TPA: GAF domain-containing protein, partial [Pyrinomonadaceae bacterium]|nr:GAF domain-containing protein [Pyrinomonadaceae bacterium]